MSLKVHTHPVLRAGSMLLPERPELRESRVGDCFSVSAQEDTLTGRDSPYGSKLRAREKNRKETKSCCQSTNSSQYSNTSYSYRFGYFCYFFYSFYIVLFSKTKFVHTFPIVQYSKLRQDGNHENGSTSLLTQLFLSLMRRFIRSSTCS